VDTAAVGFPRPPHYASPEEKAKGQWWDRRLIGVYFPASRLK